jgi:uncharacterized protein YggU (UPF0235/DUF167 family)
MARLSIKVSTKASRSGATGWLGDVLKISVTAAPERGKANAAVVRLLAGLLGVPPSAIRIERGAATSRKVLEVAGLDPDELERRMRGHSIYKA